MDGFSYFNINCSDFTAQKCYATFLLLHSSKLQQAEKSDSL